MAISEQSAPFGQAALGLVLAGTAVLLAGLVVTAMTLANSANAIGYAIERTRSLGR